VYPAAQTVTTVQYPVAEAVWKDVPRARWDAHHQDSWVVQTRAMWTPVAGRANPHAFPARSRRTNRRSGRDCGAHPGAVWHSLTTPAPGASPRHNAFYCRSTFLNRAILGAAPRNRGSS
jgi:hypothetical protein